MYHVNKKIKVSPPSGYKWLVVDCPIVGIENYIENVEAFIESENYYLTLVRQSDNQYDSNAIAVFFNESIIGYIPKEIATIITNLPEDVPLGCEVRKIYTNEENNYISINIAIFANTKISLGEIVQECKIAVEERFYHEDEDNDDEEDEIVTCEDVKDFRLSTNPNPVGIKMFLMLLFLGVVLVLGFFIFAVEIFKKIFGH